MCASAGSDLVEWLYSHVEGFADRRDAKKYANNLLKAGYIRHTVNKITFSEQCYYVFGDLGQRTFASSTSEPVACSCLTFLSSRCSGARSTQLQFRRAQQRLQSHDAPHGQQYVLQHPLHTMFVVLNNHLSVLQTCRR